MTQFPSEFPANELKQLIKFVTKQDSDIGKAALAGYAIIGYGGYQAFGQPVISGTLIGAKVPTPFGAAPAIGVVATPVGPVVELGKPDEILNDPTPQQVQKCVSEINDLINASQVISQGGLAKAQLTMPTIPSWVYSLILQILETVFTNLK